jgi:sugar (pentulose or hexulose) kinase
MSMMILSADIGTSSLKAAFIDFNGRLKSFSRAAYLSPGAEGWEEAFARVIKELYAQTQDAKIDGVCISGNGPTLVPLCRGGEVLPPLYWHDGKAALPPEGEPLSFFLPRAAWLKKNTPSEYEKVRLFVSSHEWLASRLGAEALTVLPSPSYEPYYWDDEQLRLFDLDREKFPPFVKMGTLIGKVSPEAACFFGSGLKSGTPIISGGPDFVTALIGTGTCKPGDVCDRAGSSEGINVCSSVRPFVSGQAFKGKDVRALPHAMEGLWNLGILIPSSGRLFECYRTATGQENRSYGELLGELIPSTLDTEIYKGDFFFPSGGFSGDYPAQSEKTALGRAVLCAIGFSVRSALETLDESGFPVREMRVSGGQGKDPHWNQLKADITGVSLTAGEIPDGELAGNAVLSAVALGTTRLEEAMDTMIRFSGIYRPRPQTALFWKERYALFSKECGKK